MIVSRLLLAGLVLAARPALAAPEAEPTGRLTARIYDYANVNPSQVEAAQQHVADTYRQIGVNLQWLMTARPNSIASGKGSWPTDVEEAAMLSVALMSNAMTAPSTRE